MKNRIALLKRIRAILIVLGLVASESIFIPAVFATTYTTKASVILTNMDATGAGPVIIAFTPGNNGTSLTLQMGGGSVATSQTVANDYGTQTCQTITGASAYLPGSPTAAGASGTITFSGITAYTPGTSYCAVLTSSTAVTNPVAGVETATLTAGTDNPDALQIDIISNDQVVITAVVPASFTLAISPNSDPFTSNLSGSTIGTTTGVTATVNTNAQTGWYLFASDEYTGLKSPSENYTIASRTPGTNATLTTGTDGYVTAVPSASIVQGSGAGTVSATTAYASTASGQGSGLDTNIRPIATSTGTADAASVLVKEYATISPVTAAGADYTDTITLVGAGSF